MIFKRKLLNLLYDSNQWSWDFKVEFFTIQSDIPGTLLCLVVVDVVSIIRVLVVFQKTKNVVVRCHFCWMSFLGGAIFDERSALFVTLREWVPKMSGGISHFDQASLLGISGYITWPSHIL